MRDLPLSNGSLLINFDSRYQIRDIYFPHVGQENHSCGYPFRLGIWVDGVFSWTFSDAWQRQLTYEPNALITKAHLTNIDLGIELLFQDTVCNDMNVLIRQAEVFDRVGPLRDIRLFLHQDFRLYENKVGDTAFYDPKTRALIHYKKHRYFLVNTLPHFHQFATGRKAFQHQEGTWRDAEDGWLAGGAITEGSVDSTIAVHSTGNFSFFYWIAAGTSHTEVANIDRAVKTGGPQTHINARRRSDAEWLASGVSAHDDLPDPVSQLYRRSLLITGSQIDKNGAIIAATDSEVTDRATDHYAYLWPRDGAFVANALDRAGYPAFTRRFLTLCTKIIDERGYFHQKYNADGSLGSGWHAYWDARREREMVPIQEDETALVLWCAWENYARFPDEAFAREIYSALIVPAADFLCEYLDNNTGLPLPSWNLWEDRHGIHTFTCATVVAGLRGASNFADLFDETEQARHYSEAADEIVRGMREHLFIDSLDRFIRGLLVVDDGSLAQDMTVDASLFGVFYFSCFDPEDPTVVSTMKAIEEKLYLINGEFGGVGRFENDGYMRVSDDVPGNPWIICTLWLAEYYISVAKTQADLGPALELIEWVTRVALPSGVLPEQVHPKTGEPLSVSPLTWSHSTFMSTICSYRAKLNALRGN